MLKCPSPGCTHTYDDEGLPRSTVSHLCPYAGDRPKQITLVAS